MKVNQMKINEPSHFTAEVGRVKTFRLNPERGTLPVSCTIWVHKPGLIELGNTITFVTHALQVGSGINVHLDYWQPLHNVPKSRPDLAFSGVESEWAQLLPGQLYRKLVVEDSINGPNGIIQSLMKYIELALGGTDVLVDLSKLRPAGSTNELGMVATGPDSFSLLFIRANEYIANPSIAQFLAFLSSFNEVIRRGGVYKNGALTTSMPTHHLKFEEYLDASPSIHPWLKKGASLVKDFRSFTMVKDSKILDKVNAGELWLEKLTDLDGNWITFWQYHGLGEANILRANVCREIRIKSGETCTIGHVNAGMCKPKDLPQAFALTMRHLIEVHSVNAPGKDALRQFVDGKIDRQVGLGIIGWANFLRQAGVTYCEFTDALKNRVQHPYAKEVMDALIEGFTEGKSIKQMVGDIKTDKPAIEIANQLFIGYAQASALAKEYGLYRAFCIAPTASSSYAHEDLEGFTTTPEIAPPIYQQVERLSQILAEDIIYEYGNVETVEMVGWDTIWEMTELWQKLMNLTGLAHSISFNLLEDMTPTDFKKWCDGPLLTTYYRLVSQTGHLDKTGSQLVCSITNPECEACAG